MGRGSLGTVGGAMFLLAAEGVGFAQQQPLCIPGTQVCARANGNGGVQAGGTAQGQVGPSGASGNASGNANANANVNANANANANARGNANGNANTNARGNTNANSNAGGNANANTNTGIITNANVVTNARGNTNSNSSGNDSFDGYGNSNSVDSPGRPRYSSAPIRFGAGLALCGTLKAGIYSGSKGGPCFAVSFRTERISFEMETQLLIGGTRHSIDWVFPMSFVIPLTSQWSLYEGLQLRVGGSPIGVTFAKAEDGGNYIRFGLHAGLSYEWGISRAVSWRVFDARAFLDFGTRREVDLHGNFLDFGGQLSTAIVF